MDACRAFHYADNSDLNVSKSSSSVLHPDVICKYFMGITVIKQNIQLQISNWFYLWLTQLNSLLNANYSQQGPMNQCSYHFLTMLWQDYRKTWRDKQFFFYSFWSVKMTVNGTVLCSVLFLKKKLYIALSIPIPKGIVQSKMKIVNNYSPSCHSKPKRPLFTFGKHIWMFDEIRELSDPE